MLFGGFANDGVPKGDTWLWDGESWRLAAENGPPPRKWPAAAYDAARNVIVLHGGREGQGRAGDSLDDTWIWDGERWTELDVDGPTPRDHHRAVYDKRRDRVVLFGGWNGEALLDDTWEWDGERWGHATSEGPSPRAPFGMAYDDARESVVLAGGKDLDRSFRDMWTWDGFRWRLLTTSIPGDRGFHAMTYAPYLDSMLLFGGRDGDHLLNDLLRWDGDDWVLLSADGPLLRGVYASAYDDKHKRFLIHGSGNRVDGHWQLDDRTWAWSLGDGWQVVSGKGGAAEPRGLH